MLTPWRMRIDAVGPAISTASGIKILRSVMIKGLEAFVLECVLGARRYGVEEIVLASFGNMLARP